MAAIRIAIDVMGGDHGLRTSCPATLQVLSQSPQLQAILVGDRSQVDAELIALFEHHPAFRACRDRINVVHAEQVVEMTDRPSHALRHKSMSSMRVAIDMLQRGEVDAVVSAGNTGALVAISHYVLKTFPGIDRPAICSPIPTARHHSYLLDLGANVDCSAEHLHQFAVMGSAMAAALDNNPRPSVALLNIGAEDSKGNEQVRTAAALLEADSQLNYRGFIEGDSLYAGGVDVVVCDGFVGNVALKVCEGTASLISKKIKAQFQHNALSRLLGALAQPVLRRLQSELNPARYNGACLLGLRGLVVKSHGNSSVESFAAAIERAYHAVHNRLIEQIQMRIAEINTND